MAATADQAKPKSKKKYAVGDKVFVVEYSRYKKETSFSEGTVTKVGRKYFTFTVTITGHGNPWEKSIMASLNRKVVTERNDESVYVYSSREEYELELELSDACTKIRKYFQNNQWNLARELSLDQARQILAILKLDETQSDV